MDWIVNNNQLTWKLVWMLKTYKTCNLTVRFSKYEFYNKLLGGVTLLRVTPIHQLITCYWIHILRISLLDYMVYMFLKCMPIFITIRCYLLFDL